MIPFPLLFLIPVWPFPVFVVNFELSGLRPLLECFGVAPRLLQTLSRELVLMSVRSAGFSMRTVGRHASVQEAPILVAAPHSSFFDTVAAMLGYPLPSAVVRSKSRGLFFLSSMLLSLFFPSRWLVLVAGGLQGY